MNEFRLPGLIEINFGLIVGRCCFDKKYQVIAPIILGLYWEENLVLIGGLYWTLMVFLPQTMIRGRLLVIKTNFSRAIAFLANDPSAFSM